jgi:dipeptidyl aminopeptidase/acylaminoacyl peptidase
VSADGRWLLFTDEMPSNRDIRRVSIREGGATQAAPGAGADPATDAQHEPLAETLLDTPADELSPRCSPDGRYLLFQSNETPSWDVQVMDTVTGGRWMVSQEGGFNPRWSRDGSRILYSTADKIMVVDVRLTPEFSVSRPRLLMDTPEDVNSEFDIDSDGTRVLFLSGHDPEDKEESERPALSVVLNWFAEIESQSSSVP